MFVIQGRPVPLSGGVPATPTTLFSSRASCKPLHVVLKIAFLHSAPLASHTLSQCTDTQTHTPEYQSHQ